MVIKKLKQVKWCDGIHSFIRGEHVLFPDTDSAEKMKAHILQKYGVDEDEYKRWMDADSKSETIRPIDEVVIKDLIETFYPKENTYVLLNDTDGYGEDSLQIYILMD